MLRDRTLAGAWLRGRITVDVARLSGQELGASKKPIPKGGLIMASILMLGFAYWTYVINARGFVWYSVFPGTVALLSVISILGMTTNRELAEGERVGLPPGATPVRTGTEQEQVAASAQLASTGDDLGRFSDRGVAATAIQFVETLGQGRYEDALGLADDTWVLCRVQAWLWNNREVVGLGDEEIGRLAPDLASQRADHPLWADFVLTEANLFGADWRAFAPGHVGAASKRRRVAADMEVVIVVLLEGAGSDGFFVESATLLTGALTILLRREGSRWLVLNHVGIAPPTPGMPPTWWALWDPAVEALPEPA